MLPDGRDKIHTPIDKDRAERFVRAVWARGEGDDFPALAKEVMSAIYRNGGNVALISRDVHFWRDARDTATAKNLPREASVFALAVKGLEQVEAQSVAGSPEVNRSTVLASRLRAPAQSLSRAKGLAFVICFGLGFMGLMHLMQLTGYFWNNLDLMGVVFGTLLILVLGYIVIKETSKD